MTQNKVVAEGVELFGTDPGLDMGGDKVQRFSRELAGNAHFVDLDTVFQGYFKHSTSFTGKYLLLANK
jgi:hypothetical protein